MFCGEEGVSAEVEGVYAEEGVAMEGVGVARELEVGVSAPGDHAVSSS